MAHGFSKAGGGTMAVGVHDTVGLLHASMAIFNAWADRSPIFTIVGTGPLDAARRRPWIDWIHTVNDQGALIRDFTVWNDQPTSPDALLASTDRAWSEIHRAPVGPGLIGLDVDLQEAEVDAADYAERLALGPAVASRLAPDPDMVRAIADGLRAATAPLFVTDRPIEQRRVGPSRGAGPALPAADSTRSAAASRSRSARRTTSPRASMHAMAAADYLVLVEARDPTWALGPVDLHTRQSLTKWRGTPAASIGLAGAVDKSWMVAESPGPDRLELTAEPELALDALLDAWGSEVRPLAPAFAAAAAMPGPSLPDAPSDARGIHRGHLGRAIATALEGVDWTVSNGVIGNWARRTLRFQEPDQFLGRSLAGGLGYGPGASLGAGLAYRGSGRVVVDLQGDGDFLYSPQSLWTAAHHQIPLLFVIDSNRSYFQDERHQRAIAVNRGRSPERVGVGIAIDEPAVDHAKLAQSFGISAIGPIDDYADLERALVRAVAQVRAGEPVVLDVRTSPN